MACPIPCHYLSPVAKHSRNLSGWKHSGGSVHLMVNTSVTPIPSVTVCDEMNPVLEVSEHFGERFSSHALLDMRQTLSVEITLDLLCKEFQVQQLF